MELYLYFLIAGACLVFAAYIWNVVQGFQVHIGWGFGLLLLPMIALFFLIAYWNKAKYPFFVNLLGLAFLGLGIYISEVNKVA